LDSFRLTFYDTKSRILDDILVDGYLSHTFSPQGAHSYFTLMFRTSNFRYHMSYSQGMWYMVPYLPQSSLGTQTQSSPPPLDFSVRTTQGTVVPQQRWTPPDEIYTRRHVEVATFQPSSIETVELASGYQTSFKAAIVICTIGIVRHHLGETRQYISRSM